VNGATLSAIAAHNTAALSAKLSRQVVRRPVKRAGYRHRPDVTLLDLRMLLLGGVGAIEQIPSGRRERRLCQ
jgi:hypothetical protein